ncbi:hypothetical protein [Nonomuraea typhae]|uniref:Uncharacterized protein n=1 Tax=Nonomuraea typhae TaxID=2603600 RepID=A0ABW7YYP4_9ACTN
MITADAWSYQPDQVPRAEGVGGQTITGDVIRNHEFCCGDDGKYRLGAVR